ncbi:PAC2 family protein [Salinibacterium sp. G-O1]|uniref:proteasome assembly chaperone family protein n=1 Tax=Salinibacterium sp. G-O1 TaxID=3046208 RepID=UPI0024BAF0C5|nr:PAC2 family protein [Salinibacterium sp. G-O1]MDJ0335266.1 PAC2 family protein [Salinibacterium sp. G-O1]
MQNPAGLYDLTPDITVPVGLNLVAALTGFSDAGSAVTQLSDYLLDTMSHSVVARFDNDTLLDYRARRPTIYFDQDHVADYTPLALNLYLMKDELDQPFLLLTGYEPDFQWDRFTAAVLQLIARYEVKATTWVHAIPMPVPHTRPVGTTVSGNRTELIETMSLWRPRTQAPANALHLLEYRLSELSHPVAGFVLLIPHYLAETEYPLAAVSAIESVSAATGLIFPTDRLREEGREFLAKIDGQVENNQELARLVGTLEERHDSYIQDNPLRSPLTDIDGALPSADEIAAELQNFLASRRNGDDSAPSI